MTDKENIPKSPEPYWRDFLSLPEFPSLKEDIEVDAVIVGGGMTGLTSAYLLSREGVKVAVLEAGKLLNGVTGHTTAKVTAQHGMIYDEFIQNIGQSKARLYYEANMEAARFIKKIINEQNIDCDYQEQDAYLYAATDEYAHKLEKEYSAYQILNIDGELKDSIPFNIDVSKALVMKNQAQFHPLKYLAYFVKAIRDQGGAIFEDTTAVNVKGDRRPVVHTRTGRRVTAKHVLACSHFPFYEGRGLYSTRMYADRSYVLAAKTKEKYPGGMYLSVDTPNRSLRSATMGGEELVIIGGESHKTGQGKDTMEHYKALERFGRDLFEIESFPYRWSAQDLITLDKLPYIGEITEGEPRVLIGTGYRKWGMTNGTAAALLFRDIILDQKSVFRELYTPSRFYIQPSLKNFFKENGDVVKHLIEGKFDVPKNSSKEISPGEAAVVSVDGQRKGAFRNDDGELYIVDTTCTHMGCEVEWNSGERTWDCPCHGSRFSYTGEVVEGPAEKPLQQHDHTLLDNFTSEHSGY